MFKRCLIGLLSLLCILLSAPSCAPNASRELEIRFLDVGQADAILIRTSVGDVLIDAGSNDSQVALCNRLAQLGVERLALAVFTHHGANASTGARFLQAVSPDYAVISCGAGNFYGHPHGELIARLEAVGAEILRTDLCGEVVFYSDGVSLYYE